jgi:hypothetical protein
LTLTPKKGKADHFSFPVSRSREYGIIGILSNKNERVNTITPFPKKEQRGRFLFFREKVGNRITKNGRGKKPKTGSRKGRKGTEFTLQDP